MIEKILKKLRDRQDEIENRIWNIWSDDTQVWLSQPTILLQYDVNMNRWGKLQSEVLKSHLTQIVPHSTLFHMCIRYRPLDLAVSTKFLQDKGVKFEILDESKERPLMILPDCNSPDHWALLLATDEISPMSKFICALDHQPSDWKSIMTNYYSIVQRSKELIYKNLTSKPTKHLYLISYSVDNDLVIRVRSHEKKALLNIIREISIKYDLNVVHQS